MEAGPRLLLNDESAAAELISRRLTEDGVDLRSGATVRSVHRESDGIHLDAGNDEHCEIAGGALLLSVGRTPNLSGHVQFEAG